MKCDDAWTRVESTGEIFPTELGSIVVAESDTNHLAQRDRDSLKSIIVRA